MWILQLNDMRFANIENVQAVFRAETREQIEAFLKKETVVQAENRTTGKNAPKANNVGKSLQD